MRGERREVRGESWEEMVEEWNGVGGERGRVKVNSGGGGEVKGYRICVGLDSGGG